MCVEARAAGSKVKATSVLKMRSFSVICQQDTEDRFPVRQSGMTWSLPVP